MVCPQCGKENIDRAPFCAGCGKKLTYVENGEAAHAASPAIGSDSQPAQSQAAASANQTAQPQAAASTYQPVQSQATASSNQTAQPQATASTNQAPQPQVAASPYQPAQSQAAASFSQAPQPQAAAPQPQQAATSSAGGFTPPPASNANVVYANGCMGAAWSDITKSEGWVGRIALLGLINIVPILNWVVTGYAMRWSRKLSLGEITSMPKTIFGERNFVNGAFAFLISLILGIIASLAGGVLGIIPILGFLAAIAISLFLAVFQGLSIMRSAIADRLGAAFDIGKIWEALKRKPGQAFCATVLPGVIVGLIVGVVLIVICLLFMIPIIGDIAQIAYHSSYSYYSYYDSMDPFLVLQILGLFVPMMFVCYVIAAFSEAIIIVWTYRAVGHYVARYALDWASLASNPYYY